MRWSLIYCLRTKNVFIFVFLNGLNMLFVFICMFTYICTHTHKHTHTHTHTHTHIHTHNTYACMCIVLYPGGTYVRIISLTMLQNVFAMYIACTCGCLMLGQSSFGNPFHYFYENLHKMAEWVWLHETNVEYRECLVVCVCTLSLIQWNFIIPYPLGH